MNVISNDCVGGYVYMKQLKSSYGNPFIWSSIDFTNFCTLIQKFDTIDFSNITCELVFNDTNICKPKSFVPKINIDGKVDVYYFHYIEDKISSVPTKASGYTLYNDIVNYTKNLYFKRLDNMNEPPIFIWDVTKYKWYNKEDADVIKKFKELDNKYVKIVYKPNVTNESKNNLIILNKENKFFEVDQSASNIYNSILKEKYER